jgi:MFS family permease
MTAPGRVAGDGVRVRRGELTADAAVAVAQVALGFLIGALGACLILLARDLDVARTRLAWLSAGFGVALLVAGPAGPALLAGGGRRVLRASAATLGVGAAALALAPGLLVAEAGALLLGAGGAGIVLATAALLTGPSAARRLSRVNAVASLCGAGAPLALSAVDLLPGSGRLALLLPVPLLAWLATTRRTRPVTAGPAGAERVGVARAAAGRAEARPEAGRPGAGRVEAGRVLARWAAVVLAVMAEFAFVVWGASRLQDSGLSVSGAAAAAAAFPLGMAGGRFAAAHLVERLPVVPFSVLLVLAATAVLVSPAGPAPCTVALATAGLGIAALYPVTLAGLMHEPGLAAPHGAALGATASGTAVVAGPLLVSQVASATTLRAAFVVVVPLLLGLLALRRLPARQPPAGVRSRSTA